MRNLLSCALGPALCALGLALCTAGLAAQDSLPAGAARVLVTVTELKRGAPPVSPAEFTVEQGSAAWKVLGWQRAPAAVQLWIAVDEDTNSVLNGRLADLQKFILHLPSAFQVGVAYLSLSGVEIAAPLNNNHKAVAAAVRPVKATPGISPDPYASLEALFDRWPAAPETRREVLVLSDGSVHAGGDNNIHNPSVQNLIARAQREGIIVFSLSVADSGNAMGVGDGSEVQPSLRAQGGGNTMNSPAATPEMEETQGENNLREVADRTGGWWNVVTYPMAILPGELAAVLDCLQHQFYLVFAVPAGTPAGLAQIKVKSKAKGAKVSVASGVSVGS